MPLRTAAKLCPHAIFVDGHPDRYRECSEKVHKVLATFSPLVEMASIDEAYLDMTGTERLHGPPLRAAHSLHQKHEDRDATELLDRDRHLAPDRESLLRPSQAQRSALGRSRPGSEISRAARCARYPRRRQSHGAESARHRHPEGRRSGPLRRSRTRTSASASGVWPSPAKRAAKMRADGSTPKSASDDRCQVHQPRAHLQRRHRQLSAARIHLDAPFRNGRAAPARSTDFYARTSSSNCATRTSRPSPAPTRCPRPPNSTPKSSSRSAPCFARTGRRAQQVRLLGVHVSSFEEQARRRSICSKTTASSAGRKLWPPPTGCAIDSAKRSVGLASGMRGVFRERTHENPASLPGKASEEERRRRVIDNSS